MTLARLEVNRCSGVLVFKCSKPRRRFCRRLLLLSSFVLCPLSFVLRHTASISPISLTSLASHRDCHHRLCIPFSVPTFLTGRATLQSPCLLSSHRQALFAGTISESFILSHSTPRNVPLKTPKRPTTAGIFLQRLQPFIQWEGNQLASTHLDMSE